MVTINFITCQYVALSMNDPNIATNTNRLLQPRRCNFKIEFLDISEYEFMQGERESNVRVKITEVGGFEPILEGMFFHYERFASTAPHIKNDRYVALTDKNLHFLAIWSDRLNNYCEMFINDYAYRTCERFIP